MNAVHWVIGAVVFATCSAAVGRADEPIDFRFTRPIQVGALTQDEIVAVPLDSDLYAATRNGFPDLRVVDANQKLVPFVIRHKTESQTQQVRRTWTAESPELKFIDDGSIEIVISLKADDPSPRGLRFITPLRDFEQQVRVLGIVDGTESVIVEDALIFDYSRIMDVRQVDVSLPESTARQFRVVVQKLTLDQESRLVELTRSISGGEVEHQVETSAVLRRPFRIDRLEFWNEQAEESHEANLVTAWPLAEVRMSEDKEDKTTIVEFSSQHEPLTSLRIVTDNHNFHRRARVQTGIMSDGGVEWTNLAEAPVSQFQLRDLREDHLTIALPETRHDRYRLVIENADNTGLSVSGVEAVGHQHEIVLLKSPNTECRLVYGSDTAMPPMLDTSSLTQALAQKIVPVAGTLGPPTPIAASTAAKPADMKSLLNNPILLGGIVAVLVIALGWGLYQASRRIEQSPTE